MAGQLATGPDGRGAIVHPPSAHWASGNAVQMVKLHVQSRADGEAPEIQESRASGSGLGSGVVQGSSAVEVCLHGVVLRAQLGPKRVRSGGCRELVEQRQR